MTSKDDAPEMTPINVALLGLSHLHPRSYMATLASIPAAKAVAAADSEKAIREAFGNDFGIPAYENWEELLDSEQVDLALVFLPHDQCPDAAVACAERGIHAMVEKPMAASSQGVARMIKAARNSGTILTTPYAWRYHPVARQMKSYVAQGSLGRIVGCEGRCAAGRLDRYIAGNARWMLNRRQSGGGPMYNLGVHWVDFYRWILEDEVVEAVGKNVHVNTEYDVEDNSFALLTFSRGTVVALDISYTVPASYPNGRDLYLGLRGTQGVLSWSPSFEGIRERLFVCSDSGAFESSPRRHIDFELDPQPGYAGVMGYRYMVDVVEAVAARTAPPITAEDGLKALQVVEAIYRSAETGQSIKVPDSDI
jgi:predicted dehydrogenase